MQCAYVALRLTQGASLSCRRHVSRALSGLHQKTQHPAAALAQGGLGERAVLLLGDLLYHGVCIWRYAGVDETRAADAAIVLGAAAYESGPSPVYTERLNHGIWLYQQGYVQKLILTGGTAAGNRCFIPCRRTCGRSYFSRHEQHQTSCGRSRFGCCSGISNGLLSALIAIEPRSLRGICFTTPHKKQARHVGPHQTADVPFFCCRPWGFRSSG